jgi:hypothetical protein
MSAFRGIARGCSGPVRLRVALAIAAASVFMLVAGSASASRIETSPSHAEELVGSDWVGRVSLFFSEIDSPSGRAAFSLSEFRFANLCSKRGSELKATIRVGNDKRFDFRGDGFSVVGHVIGSISHPAEIAGTASVASHGCNSGPWWFGVKPAPHG